MTRYYVKLAVDIILHGPNMPLMYILIDNSNIVMLYILLFLSRYPYISNITVTF